ncbi:MAG: DNA recombination protein RmuC [Gracilibacteraceae bacterium]|jgi:DNA recombination protein RmuC|nr:DNA recombination protein RmuC [Gracilibacteraceae bacterium]
METGFGVGVFVLGLLIGGVLGVLAALARGKSGQGRLAEENAVLREKNARIPQLESVLAAERREKEENQRLASEQRASVAELLVRLEVAEDRQLEQAEVLAKAKDEMNQAFRVLAADALKQNNEMFVEMANSSLARYQVQANAELEKRETAVSELVKPIRDSLAQVHDKIHEIEQVRVGAYHGLSEQVVSMAAGQEKLQRETSRLVMALKTPIVRGRWGEIQLKRVVELAGMLERCDFEQQPVTDGENGRQRPDLIVHMPGHKRIVVDAKVPLAAYMEALEVEDEEGKAVKMRLHARQVRQHINNLTSKAYWRGLGFTPELVVMFLPGEMLFSAALEQDPALLEYGAQQRVIVATPTTLIALLKTVAYGWQHEQLAENARQIQQIAQELYDRIGGLVGHVDDMGGALRKAAGAYNAMIGTLESRVLVSVRRFHDLGVSAGEPLAQLEGVREDLRETPELGPESDQMPGGEDA